jgi:hypothetical protein
MTLRRIWSCVIAGGGRAGSPTGRVIGVRHPRGHRQRHPRTQRKRAQHLLVQLFLGVGPPDADAAQLAFRPPQPEKVPGRGELLCSDRLGGTTPVDLRGICARRW